MRLRNIRHSSALHITVSQIGRPFHAVFQISRLVWSVQALPLTTGSFVCPVVAGLLGVLVARSSRHESCRIASVVMTLTFSLFATQGEHGIRAGCPPSRQYRPCQCQQQHDYGRKCTHPRIEWTYIEQERTQQVGRSAAPGDPGKQPTAASLTPEPRISMSTPDRRQPSAMRTAISCLRSN